MQWAHRGERKHPDITISSSNCCREAQLSRLPAELTLPCRLCIPFDLQALDADPRRSALQWPISLLLSTGPSTYSSAGCAEEFRFLQRPTARYPAGRASDLLLPGPSLWMKPSTLGPFQRMGQSYGYSHEVGVRMLSTHKSQW